MKKISSILLLAACFLSGCSTSGTDGTPALRIAPEIGTRVTGLHFDRDDRIGLTVVKGSETYLDNRELTYDGAAFTAPGVIWYDNINETSTLTAYYP